MGKAIFYLVIIFIGTYFCAQAQKVEMKFGQPIVQPGNVYFHQLVYADAQYSYVLYPDPRYSHVDAPYLAKIDKGGAVVFTQKLDLKDKKIYQLDMFVINDKMYLVFKRQQDKNTQVVCQLVDKNGNLGEQKVIYENITGGHVEFVQSEDRTKFGICKEMTPEVGIGRIAGSGFVDMRCADLDVHVFDGDLKEIATGKVKMTNKDDVQDHWLTLGNDGSLFVVSHIIGTKAKKMVGSGSGRGFYDYTTARFAVAQISSSGQKDVTPFKGDKTLLSMRVFCCDNNETVLSGFYGDIDKGTIDGMFASRYDNSESKFGALAYKECGESSHAILSDAARWGFNGSTLEMETFQPVSAVVVGDNAYVVSEISYGTALSTSQEKLDMMVTIVNADGGINKMIPVSKYQEEDDPRGGYCSFLAFKSGDDMCLMFNDNSGNYGDKKAKKTESWAESVVVLARFNGDGLRSSEAIYRNKDLGAVFEPLNAVRGTGEEKNSFTVMASHLQSAIFTKDKYIVGKIRYE